MKPSIVALLSLLSFSPIVLFFGIKTGQTQSETRTFNPGQSLRLILPRGDVSITKSSDPHHFSLRYTPKSFNSSFLKKVQLHFRDEGTGTTIEFVAPTFGEIETELQVPDPAMLDIDLGGGDLKISGIAGNKRLHVGAGDITVASVGDYRSIEASTRIGSISAAEFGQPQSTGITGKILSVTGNGHYVLNLSVTTGDISLKR